MRKAKSKERRVGSEISNPYILPSVLYILCSLFFCGCSSINPPADYYQQVLEMEEYGEQSRRDTGRHPDEIVEPIRNSEPVITGKSSVQQLMPEAFQQEAEEVVIVEPEEEVQNEPEVPPQREVIQKSSSSQAPFPEPIAVASDVIKSALRTADLGVSARTVELVNGRLSGGRNSVRVSFFSESLDLIDDKFVAICAVIYHLNSGTHTVDTVIAMAEDEQANLLAIIQSDMKDVTAWMTNEISRAEWFSRVTKKML
jgi:hypothetical protein